MIHVLLPCLLAAAAVADEAARQAAPTRPRQAPVVQSPAAAPAARDRPAEDAQAPKFVSEARWGLAGYNNNEVYYTVFVTNQDTRIIRCTTEITGYYFENGSKLAISDRQITTVFPNEPTQVGIWMDMDQGAGATYAIKCHPL